MDINEVLANNTGLVYAQLKRFNMLYDQDAESEAYMALYKAIQTYDATSGNAFSTYAVCCIANSIRYVIRSRKKVRQLVVCSYDAPVAPDTEAALLDTLPGSSTSELRVLREERDNHIRAAIERTRASLTGNTKRIFEIWYESDFTLTQSEIAKMIGVSQPTVSKALNITRYKLKQELGEDY